MKFSGNRLRISSFSTEKEGHRRIGENVGRKIFGACAPFH